MKIIATSKTILILLLVGGCVTLLSAPSQAQLESEYNWAPGGESLQWFDPGNWEINNNTTPYLLI